jgi:eukaryotic-like serine/threonine-protein kinase
MSPDTQRPPRPARLGKYEIQGLVDSGATGVVYRALDPRSKRPLAVRTMRRGLLGDDERASFIARLQHEAQAAARLAHPGIVKVHEFGTDAGTAYVAMEFVEGGNLQRLLEAGRHFDVEEAVDLLSQLLEALQHAHERGIWHRDVKPANILLTTSGRLKLADFGIARLESSAPAPGGAMLGTPGYIAPEVYLGKSCDHRVDLFAAGAIAYRLLADRAPFPGPADDIMYKVCYQTPVQPSVAAGNAALARYDAPIMRALAKRPADRYADAVEFRDALREAHDRVIDITVAGTEISKDAQGLPSPADAAGDAALARLEAHLARFIGPMARVMIKRAAAHARDESGALQWLAEHAVTEADRASFLSYGDPSGPLTGGRATRPPPVDAADGPTTLSGNVAGRRSQDATAVQTRPPATPARAAPSAAEVARATRLLTPRLGPIAPVLVRRAAAETGVTRETFLKSLAAELVDAQDRADFLARFGAGS